MRKRLPRRNQHGEVVSDYVENICRKLRLTAQEFGQKAIENAVIIGSEYDGESISGHKYIDCPTVSGSKLGGVEFKVARFFEDF